MGWFNGLVPGLVPRPGALPQDPLLPSDGVSARIDVLSNEKLLRPLREVGNDVLSCGAKVRLLTLCLGGF